MSHCQSCDMPISKDPKNGGTDDNGEHSIKYCSLCYENGAFKYKGTDVKDYQKYVIENMVADGWMWPMAWLMTRRIPKLERWRP